MRRDIRDDHLRRMAEPESLRTLRRQKERIEERRRQAVRDCLDCMAVARLRQEIRELGEEPEA